MLSVKGFVFKSLVLNLLLSYVARRFLFVDWLIGLYVLQCQRVSIMKLKYYLGYSPLVLKISLFKILLLVSTSIGLSPWFFKFTNFALCIDGSNLLNWDRTAVKNVQQLHDKIFEIYNIHWTEILNSKKKYWIEKFIL